LFMEFNQNKIYIILKNFLNEHIHIKNGNF
jgi:hypothetical protein